MLLYVVTSNHGELDDLRRGAVAMPIVSEMKRYLLEQETLHEDETTLQVLQEPGKSAEFVSHVWLYETGRNALSVVVYDCSIRGISRFSQGPKATYV